MANVIAHGLGQGTEGTMRDIVTSSLSFWDKFKLWVRARPLSGFTETFSQYIVKVIPGCGSDHPEVIITNEQDIASTLIPCTDGNWVTALFRP